MLSETVMSVTESFVTRGNFYLWILRAFIDLVS
jgi:hypothetical protein